MTQIGTRYDYLIIGAGLYGSICAHELTKLGYKVIVLEKRWHIGGNCFTQELDNIHVHKYGPHIFHTNEKQQWDYINQFAEFQQYQYSPNAYYKGKLYSLPFNMNTFNQLWPDVITPTQAQEKLNSQKLKIRKINNLEQQALSLVGKDVYETLIKGYTEKQWGRPCKDLPPSIIKRLPVRFTYDSNYFNDKYQGIPKGGYTQIFKNLLKGIETRINTDFMENKIYWENKADKIIYTGPIDAFYNYQFGKLQYRSLHWENETMDIPNYQGAAVVNNTEYDTPHTRTIEHKWFDPSPLQQNTYVSKEYPQEYNGENEPYYPIRDTENTYIYNQYKSLTLNETKYLFGGRLGTYQYYDMNQIIGSALNFIKHIKPKNA